jgi:hypothetical protein
MKLAVALLAALALATPAQAALRAVFVGIDQYAFSRARVPEAGFDDLSGAVGDTLRIKAALRQARGLTLDETPAGLCQSSNATSITLLNRCATRDAILAAWRTAITASAPGDTLILYFAGHGSRFLDSTTQDQASRFNSTLMAHDARRPGAAQGADILDVEVRGFIDAATARGIRVVTWFDSCNSGTASRDGNSASRTAPDLRVTGLPPRPAPLLPAAETPGPAGAYRVHFGAAADGQDAKEIGSVGNRAGVFTTALAAALIADPNASFGDLAARVVADVTARTGSRQIPHTEGALRATLDGPEIRLPTFDVAVDSATGKLLMNGGALVGVMPGSRFAIYPDLGAALRSPMAAGVGAATLTARVARVDVGLAELAPDAPLPANLTGRLVAREIEHDFGGAPLGLMVTDPAAIEVVQQLPFVTQNPRGPFTLMATSAGFVLKGRNRTILAQLPPADAPDFAPRLKAALEKVARVEQWLAIAQPKAGVSLCVQNIAAGGDFDPAWCPPPPADGRVLKVEQPIMLSVVNEAATPRFVYVLAVGDAYDVTLLLPAFGARDPALDGGQALRQPPGQEILPDTPGRLRFVVISADQPLNAAALEQTGADVADVQACLRPVPGAFCADANRARSGAFPKVGAWSTSRVDAVVVP